MNPKLIVLVSARKDQLADFVAGLQEDFDFSVRVTADPEEAAEWTRRAAPVLVVVDGQDRGDWALGLIRRLLAVNAFTHTAMLSDRSDDEFHHLSEGLGILARLPILPAREEARRLVERLRGLDCADTTP